MASGTHKGGRVSRTRLLESSVLAARWAGPDVCSRPKGSDFPGPGSREHAQGPNPQAIPRLRRRRATAFCKADVHLILVKSPLY